MRIFSVMPKHYVDVTFQSSLFGALLSPRGIALLSLTGVSGMDKARAPHVGVALAHAIYILNRHYGDRLLLAEPGR